MVDDNESPIPDMNMDKYNAGQALLSQLLNTPANEDYFKHVTNTLSSEGVDSALYLLYVGYSMKSSTSRVNELKDFRTLLQTAAALGALVSRERMLTIEKFDRMWDIDTDVH